VEHYQRTFAGASIADNWEALFETIEFVRRVSKHVAEALGFGYPGEVDARVTEYIREIKTMSHKTGCQ
jgi:aminoglycoside 6-adenylyltransferase